MGRNKGQALIVAYMVVSVFITMVAVLSSKAVSEKNISQRNKLNTEAFYLAEGGVEDTISSFTSAIANYQILPDVSSYNVTTSFTTSSGANTTSSIESLESTDRLVLEGQTNVLVRNYEINSTAVHPQNNAIIVKLHQIIARRLIPTFQHSVFYDIDLDIAPGSNMNLTGRIHCNKDIYVDADSAKTLTIDSSYFRCAGDIYNKKKSNGSRLSGDVDIRVDKPGSPEYEYMDNLDSESAAWREEAINRWNGTVQSCDHGITKVSAPSVASIQPTGYYASKADVVIVNGAISKGGNTLTEGVDYPAGAITVIGTNTLYNNREGKYVKVTNINIRKLANLDNQRPFPDRPEGPGNLPFQNNLPSNGLLYATCNDAPADMESGIRLINATEIDRTKGLTVVSNDPVYIQGNFNTVNEKPASVICDSLNLLSVDWNDANSCVDKKTNNHWDSRKVKNDTTVNSAFIAGVDETTSGQYNGGLENYPRLHEDWSSVNLNIKGSFVALWNSAVATKPWYYGSPYYAAPKKRNWTYNTAFNNVNNLPPFTPWAVEARRIAWWKE